jgi:group I intron endonuclease
MRTSVVGIYCIRNMVNGNEYVGQTGDIQVRWSGHRTNLRGDKHENRHLQRAWNLYGEDAFDFFILETLDEPTTDELTAREQFHMDQRNPAYNLTPAAGSTRGYKFSLESRRRLSEAKRRLMRNPTPALRAAWARLAEMQPTPDQLDYWASKRGKQWTEAQRRNHRSRVGDERTPAQKARDERLRGSSWSEKMREGQERRKAVGRTPKQEAYAQSLKGVVTDRIAKAAAKNRLGWTETRRKAFEQRKEQGPTEKERASWERKRMAQPTKAQLVYWARIKGQKPIKLIEGRHRAARRQPPQITQPALFGDEE